MCFSASASFAAAGVTGVAGAIALTQMRHRRELLLAAAPLFFAIQQGVEGLLWLDLPGAPGGPLSHGLAFLYLLFAEPFWPVYAPLAIYLVEPVRSRRGLMLACLVAGAGASAYLLRDMFIHPQAAVIRNCHIIYLEGGPSPAGVGFAYLGAAMLPLLLSSQRTIVAVGLIVFVGFVTAYVFYLEAFVSVWCFFAAAASAVILAHFAVARRRETALVVV
jgi:hypothetical protein